MKVSIFNQGKVLLPIAWSICKSEVVSELFILDEHRKVPRDASRHLEDAASLSGHRIRVSVCNTPTPLTGSRVVILPALPTRTLGFAAQRANSIAYVRRVTQHIKRHSPEAHILVAMSQSNLLSTLIHHEMNAVPGQILALSNLQAHGLLESQLVKHLDVAIEDVTSLAIGNDETLLMLPQYCRVNGIPIDQLLRPKQIARLNSNVTAAHKGATYTENVYSLSVYLRQLITAIAKDKKTIMCIGTLVEASSCAVYLTVPAKIGRAGVEQIIQLELTSRQRLEFQRLVSRSLADQQSHI